MVGTRAKRIGYAAAVSAVAAAGVLGLTWFALDRADGSTRTDDGVYHHEFIDPLWHNLCWPVLALFLLAGYWHRRTAFAGATVAALVGAWGTTVVLGRIEDAHLGDVMDGLRVLFPVGMLFVGAAFAIIGDGMRRSRTR